MADKLSNGWLKWIVVLVVVFAVIAGGIWFFRHAHDTTPQYQTVPVTRGELIQLVTATGTINPVTNVQVGCQISGTISKLYVDYNSLVKAGQIIAEIDPRIYQAQVEQAEADLANANANLELQQIETKRSAELYTNNLVSASDNDTAIATLHEAEATVKLKQAALDNANANLGYCKIYSPVDGIVISRAVDVGQTVASSFNTPTLFQIANDLTKMQIDSSVAEADIGGVIEGQQVDFTVDAYPYRNFHGTVTQVQNSPATVNNVVTYDCVISVTNADYKLKPGMTANVSIVIAQREDALTIPNSALRFRPPETAVVLINNTNEVVTQIAQATNSGGHAGGTGGQGHRNGGHTRGERPIIHTVYVLSGDGKNAKLQPVQIRTGISDGISTEVLSGLNESDQIVTGMVSTGLTTSAATSNPFGGGMPRIH
ncbi:MAG: efflux RND transporter periplasmic adaptor subunit [Verrucomicrobiota bacterium]